MISRALSKFYLSCFISSWGDRLWYFALSIYFVTINNDSLLVTALNGLICNIATITLGPFIGSLIDKHQRMTVISISLFLQNLTVATNCCIVVLIIVLKDHIVSYGGIQLIYAIQGLIILLNIISKLASMACKISIERDWIIVIAKSAFDSSKSNSDETEKLRNDDTTVAEERQPADSELKNAKKTDFKHKLASINATVRRIDLFTAILAPLCAGLIMSFMNMSPTTSLGFISASSYQGTILSAIFFALWNLFSFLAEYVLLKSVYASVSELKKVKSAKKSEKSVPERKSGVVKAFWNTGRGWLDYFAQGIVLIPSLALSVLYLTVLSFDEITIGYAKSQKLSETSISLFQGFGSFMGVLGTIAFPLLHNRFKMYLPYIGFIGSSYQFSMLFVCFISIWLPGSPFTLANQLFSTHVNNCDLKRTPINNVSNNFTETFSTAVQNTTTTSFEPFDRLFFESHCYIYTSILVLLGGMAISRFGLWLTDLVIHQIIQESVPESKRGIFGGVCGSLNTIFDMIKYVFVIFLSDASQYGYLVIMSVTAVFTAFCLYTSYTVIMCIGRRRQKETRMEILQPTTTTTTTTSADEDSKLQEMQVVE